MTDRTRSLASVMAVCFVCGAAHAAVPMPAIVKAFSSLCDSADISAGSVLTEADRQGWRRGGPDLPQDFDPASNRLRGIGAGLLTLRVGSTPGDHATRNVCSITAASPTPGIVDDVEKILGFPPAFSVSSWSTFFAVRTGDTWVSGSRMDIPGFAKTKAEGRFFSIAVGNTPTDSTIRVTQSVPDAKPPADR